MHALTTSSALHDFMDDTHPLAVDELTAHLPADIGKTFAVAVSGGPDSMALALLAHCYAKQTKRLLRCFTVDHGLRPSSAQEALQTREWLARRGITCDILTWKHSPLKSGIPEAARAARYSLLADACLQHDITDLLLAHHADDQRETVTMRLLANSGPLGLAGMQPVSYHHQLRLLRPLLTYPKTRLLATCEAHQQAFHTDPSNHDTRFLRSRLRIAYETTSSHSLDRDPLELAADATLLRATLTHSFKQFIQRYDIFDIFGSATMPRDAWRALPDLARTDSLRRVLRTIGHSAYGPGNTSLQALCETLRDPAPLVQRTLHGCFISASAQRIYVSRELTAINQRDLVTDQKLLRWDDRFIVHIPSCYHNQGLEIRALGHPSHMLLDAIAPKLRQAIPRGTPRACLPSLWRGEKLVAVPTVGSVDKNCFSANFYRRNQL